MIDTYIIGVLTSDKSSSFFLRVLYEEKKIIDVFSGFPFDITLNAWDYIYFKY